MQKDNNNNNNNNPAPSAPPVYGRDSKDAIAQVALVTLRGSGEWHMQCVGTFLLTVFLFMYGFSSIEGGKDSTVKHLVLLMLALACYSAVNLSSSTRDNKEADAYITYGAYTVLSTPQYIETLRGSSSKYWIHVVAFVVSLSYIYYEFRYLPMDDLTRTFVASLIVSLVTQCFTLAKMMRDISDADRWSKIYKTD